MNPYKHPTATVELEGVHIVRKNGKLVQLTDNMYTERVELKDPDKIAEHLRQLGSAPDELEFEYVGNDTYIAFLDA